MRVVIPIVAGIGNAIMAAPMVRQLGRAMPEARVLVLAGTSAMAQVFERVEEVDEARVLGKGKLGMWRSMMRLRRERERTDSPPLPGAKREDVFLVPFPSNRWEYMALALASGAQRRVMHGYPVGWVRALGFVPAERVEAVRGVHDVVQNLRLLRALGIEPDEAEGPAFPVSDAEGRRAEELLAGVGIRPGERPIAVHCGSARTALAAGKRWPPEQYGGLIAALRKRGEGPVVLLEGPDEAGIGREVLGHVPGDGAAVLALTGPLGEAAGVLQRCRLYVGSDSGLAHLAGAVGTPPVTLFGASDPVRACPFGYGHLVVRPADCPCSPCLTYPWQSCRPRIGCEDAQCIRSITVEKVMAARELAVGG